MPTGRVSWFGGPHDSSDSGHTYNGGTTATPGIAIYNHATVNGYWKVKFPNGRVLVLKQTDVGPAPWTGKKVDVTYSALHMAGYNEGNFPTGANVQYSYLGKNPPKGGTSPQGAAQGGSGGTTRITKTTTPGVDNSGLRNQLKFQYLSTPPASPFSAQALAPPKLPSLDPTKPVSAPQTAPDPVKYLGQANAKTNALLSLAGNLQGAADVAPTTKTVTQRTPGAPAARAAGAGGGGGNRFGGNYSLQGGAGRQPKQRVQAGIKFISSQLGHPISVTDTTNHSTNVLGTNTPSWHITGNAADLSVGGRDTHLGDQIAAAALRYAGVPGAKAAQMARQGGVWNISHGGRQFQILWKTYVGGDHHNHVHFGVK